MSSTSEAPRTLDVPLEAAGQRLDLFLARQFPHVSRSKIQRLIDEGHVLLNNGPARASTRVDAGDGVRADLGQLPEPAPEPEPTPALHVRVLYADAAIVVVDKPAGLVVHPGAGHRGDTLVNALLAQFPDLSESFHGHRPGIVHRLDRDTSGVMVVARTAFAAAALKAQFKARQVEKVYLAAIQGHLEQPQAVIDAPIGRDPQQRKRMAAIVGGRQARTGYKVIDEAADFSLLEVRPETGRTHQIRVHFAAIGHPVAGDPVYARRKSKSARLDRLGLHAWRLRFRHPGEVEGEDEGEDKRQAEEEHEYGEEREDDGHWVAFEAPPPDDFLDLLRETGLALQTAEHS